MRFADFTALPLPSVKTVRRGQDVTIAEHDTAAERPTVIIQRNRGPRANIVRAHKFAAGQGAGRFLANEKKTADGQHCHR